MSNIFLWLNQLFCIACVYRRVGGGGWGWGGGGGGVGGVGGGWGGDRVGNIFFNSLAPVTLEAFC